MTAMDVKELKRTAKKYIDHADERMIKAVIAMLEADQGDDPLWDELTEVQREGIDLGLKQMEAGKVIPHAIAVKKIQEWLQKCGPK